MLTRRQFVSHSVTSGAALAWARNAAGGSPPELSVTQSIRDGKPFDVEVIDSHAHFSGFLEGEKLPPGVATLFRAMDRCGINLSVFSNSSAIGASDAEGFRAGNEAAIAAMKKHPGRLRAYLVF